MMVVVSDVHLGSDVGRKCRGTGRACDDLDLDPLFKTIVDHIGKEDLHTKEDRLILLGDIFDFWRKDASAVLIDSQEIVSKMKDISTRSIINYVVGNHDYSILKMWSGAAPGVLLVLRTKGCILKEMANPSNSSMATSSRSC